VRFDGETRTREPSGRGLLKLVPLTLIAKAAAAVMAVLAAGSLIAAIPGGQRTVGLPLESPAARRAARR